MWKIIKDTNEKYFVDEFGNIKSKRKKLSKFLKNGYECVNIYFENGKKQMYVHRIVAEAFIDNPKNLPEVNHIDGDKQNNNFLNLEWCTAKENQQHRINVLHKDCKGSNNPMYGKKGSNSPRFKDYILQLDLDYNIINKFESTIEAAKSINEKNGASRICLCLNKKSKTYKKFRWMYEKEYVIGGFKTL